MKSLIKKILKEETSGETKLRNLVKKLGWKKASLAVGNPKKLAEIAYHNNPYEFLDTFNNLRMEKDEENDNLYFFDEDGKKLIYIEPKIKHAFFDHGTMWDFVEKGFDVEHFRAQNIFYQWLKQTYGIKGLDVMYAHWLNYRR